MTNHINAHVVDETNPMATEKLKEPELKNFFSIQKTNLAREYISFPIPPHRVDFFEVLYIQSGAANRSIDLLNFRLHNAGIAITKPGQIVADDLETDQMEGYHLYFDLDFLNQFGAALLKLEILSSEDIHYKQLEEEEDDHIRFLLKRMEALYIRNDVETEQLLKRYFETFLFEFDTLFRTKSTENKGKSLDKANVFRMMLLNTLDVKKEIKEYAQELAVSPKHLHKLVTEAFGKSPSTLKSESLATEALFQLANTQLPVSEIAFSLGYEDAGYFSRFIKKQSGMSPLEYRSAKTQ